ncbi:MAG: LysR family transcriptional regulator substrate-binding protein [Clostridium sp.]
MAAKAAPSGEPLTTLDLTELRYEPFVLMDKTSTLRSSCDLLFEKAGFAPNILFETNNTSGIAAMVQSTLCCGIIPRYYTLGLTEGVACFSLPERPSWEIVISCQKNGYLNSGARGIHSARTGILGKLSAIILRTNINYFKSWLSTVNFTYVSIFAIMPLVIILSLRSQPCNSGFANASPHI